MQHVSTQTKPLAVSKQLEMENPDPASTQFWKVAAEKLNNKASCNEEAYMAAAQRINTAPWTGIFFYF